MQLPPTWPVALEGIPGVTSSTWKPAETAFLRISTGQEGWLYWGPNHIIQTHHENTSYHP